MEYRETKSFRDFFENSKKVHEIKEFNAILQAKEIFCEIEVKEYAKMLSKSEEDSLRTVSKVLLSNAFPERMYCKAELTNPLHIKSVFSSSPDLSSDPVVDMKKLSFESLLNTQLRIGIHRRLWGRYVSIERENLAVLIFSSDFQNEKISDDEKKVIFPEIDFLFFDALYRYSINSSSDRIDVLERLVGRILSDFVKVLKAYKEVIDWAEDLDAEKKNALINLRSFSIDEDNSEIFPQSVLLNWVYMYNQLGPERTAKNLAWLVLETCISGQYWFGQDELNESREGYYYRLGTLPLSMEDDSRHSIYQSFFYTLKVMLALEKVFEVAIKDKFIRELFHALEEASQLNLLEEERKRLSETRNFLIQGW